MLDLFMVLENIECNGVVVDKIVPTITVTVINVSKIVVPILLVVFGMMDLMKAVTAGDEKVMKENQNKLIKRIIYAVLVFLVVALVKTVIGMVAGIDSEDKVADKNTISSCINYFVNGVDQ